MGRPHPMPTGGRWQPLGNFSQGRPASRRRKTGCIAQTADCRWRRQRSEDAERPVFEWPDCRMRTIEELVGKPGLFSRNAVLATIRLVELVEGPIEDPMN